MYIKGLTDKKKLYKYVVIIGILLFILYSIDTIKTYYEKRIEIELNKESYRTLIFTSDKISLEDLSSYQVIKEKNKYSIIFNSREELLDFEDKYSSKIEEVYKMGATLDTTIVNGAFIFKIVLIVSSIILFILFYLFNLSYIDSLSKEIKLYVYLGDRYNFILLRLIVFLFHIYVLESIIIYILFYVLLFLLSKIGLLTFIFSIKSFSYFFLGIAIVMLFLYFKNRKKGCIYTILT